MMERNSETELPLITKSLIEALESIYPAKDFTPSADQSSLMYHYGQRSVVNFLKHQYKIQNENLLQ